MYLAAPQSYRSTHCPVEYRTGLCANIAVIREHLCPACRVLATVRYLEVVKLNSNFSVEKKHDKTRI
jgi:hypothetical protein